jgi:hypothetical protein
MSELKEQLIKLSDLQDLLSNKGKYFINEVRGHTGVGNDGDGYQGEYNEKFKFYKHPGLPKGVFMRETYKSDSYGSNHSLTAVEFVAGKEKTVTVLRN